MAPKNNTHKKRSTDRIFASINNITDVSLPPADNNHALKMLYLIYSRSLSEGEKLVFEEFLGSSDRISQQQLLRFLSDNPSIRRRIWEKT